MISHVIPCEVDLQDENWHENPFPTRGYERSKECCILFDENDLCFACNKFSKKYQLAENKSKAKVISPANIKAPLSKTNPQRIILSLKEQRKENKKLQEEIKMLEKEIKVNSVPVDEDLHNDIHKIMSEHSNNITPFMKLFWEEQKKLFNKGTGVRYHPMIIRFCMSLASKSASAYDELRSTNILTLPSRRTLRDYKNAIKPGAGFNPDIIQNLIKVAAPLEGSYRYIVLSFDEMKIKKNLVYDKYSGDLVGYVDLGDPDLNYASFKNQDNLATHVLIFFVRGLISDIKFELGYFGTKDLTAHQIMPIFWRAVAILEDTCKLPVIATVSDGAAPNRAFYRIHSMLTQGTITDEVIYRTINLYARERFIWFFADAPHLIKTTRNCVFNSGTGKSRLMWNDGKEIVWSHIRRIVHDESLVQLHNCNKIRDEHIQLNCYSKMNVSLAAQVLSESTSLILSNFYSPEADATAELCMYMDKFFDCLNVRNKLTGIKKIKGFLLHYEDKDDERFRWLMDYFLPYLKQWKNNTESRDGNFTKKDRQKMFLSYQTYEGLQITVHSVIEAVQYMLHSGCEYVLTERFSQDVLEEHNGKHRACGRRNDNPDLYTFGFDSNTIRESRAACPITTGNTKGAHKQRRKRTWERVDHTSLPKRNTKSDQY